MAYELGIGKMKNLDFWRAVFAEFIGCIFFLLCVTCVTVSWGNSDANISANNVEIGIGIGLAIASLAQAFGHVSGGHLNPAVSLGMIAGGRISLIQGLFYMVAQVIGGIAGSAITYGCTPKSQRGKLGATLLNFEVEPEQGLGLEFLFSFLLVFFVFSITDEKKKVEPYGTTLGIGIVILVCHVCLIPFTGCGINPARSFGPAVVANEWDDQWIYWVGPLLGGVAAALVYNFIFYAKSNTYETTNHNEMQVKVKGDTV